MEETDKAYIAGIIDGEGSIYISKQPIRLEIGMRNHYYRVGVTVKNTDERMVDYLLKHLGGHKSIQSRKTNNHRTVYTWAIFDKKAIIVLGNIYNYLLCKKEQADIIFKLRKTFGDNGYHGYNTVNNRIPEDIIALRGKCYIELRQLHSVYNGAVKL